MLASILLTFVMTLVDYRLTFALRIVHLRFLMWDITIGFFCDLLFKIAHWKALQCQAIHHWQAGKKMHEIVPVQYWTSTDEVNSCKLAEGKKIMSAQIQLVQSCVAYLSSAETSLHPSKWAFENSFVFLRNPFRLLVFLVQQRPWNMAPDVALSLQNW